METARANVPSAQDATRPRLRVAFVLGIFPLVSETFVIDQIARLIDRGVDVDIVSLSHGDEAHVAQAYFDYEMAARVTYLDYPLPWAARLRAAGPKAVRLARRHPATLLRALDVRRYGRRSLSLKLLHWAEPLVGRQYDVIHCHFGTVARDFVPVRDVAKLQAPLVTTFYGVDVSRVFQDEPASCYDELKRACSLYFVMSSDMKRRVVARGFPPDQVRVHPVSIDVARYPFNVRRLDSNDELRLMAVGRFVEKKGFDDLLRALAIVKERSSRAFSCVIVGDGPLAPQLAELRDTLGLTEFVQFPGLMPVESVIERFREMHLLIQPSKTAADGDME